MMSRHDIPNRRTSIAVPVTALAETRSAFPQFALIYEIEFLATDPWHGLAFVAAECRRAELELQSLRCTAEGLIICKVKDCRGHVDAFAGSLSSDQGVNLLSWTTVVTFEKLPE